MRRPSPPNPVELAGAVVEAVVEAVVDVGRAIVSPPGPVRPRLVERRSHTAGLPPGTVRHAEEATPARVTAVHYTPDALDETAGLTSADARALTQTPGVTWIRIDGVADTETVAAFADAFGLHPLVAEDLVHTTQRPKLEVYDDYVFVVARVVLPTDLHPDDAYCDTSPHTVGHTIEQVSFVLGASYVLSFHETAHDPFGPVLARIQTRAGRIREHGADYLLHALLDLVVDGLFLTLERIGDAAETLETRALEDPRPEVQASVGMLRRDVVVLRRSVWPLREVLAALQREGTPHVDARTLPYFRDAYDHLIGVIEVLESLREVLGAVSDLYLSAVGARQNETMKALTIAAAVFLPLTFLTGLFGMNFDTIPGLHWEFGFLGLLIAMALVAAATIAYFRHRDWL